MAIINGLGGAAGFGENSLTRNDDGSSEFIDLSSAFRNGLNFFGTTYTGLFINTNGSVTFMEPFDTFTPSAISDDSTPGIFPFWADVDTLGGAVAPSPGGVSQGTNLVHFHIDDTDGRFIVTWDDVGYFNSNVDLVNTFQLVLTDLSNLDGFDPGDFSFSFAYEDIQWTTGDASGGTGGLGGTPARAGYSSGSGNGDFFELPSSGDQEALLSLDSEPGVRFVSDGSGVVFPPDAQDDAFEVDERNTVSGNLLLDNGNGADIDPEDAALSITAVNNSAENIGRAINIGDAGRLTVQANGDFTFTANLDSDLDLGASISENFGYTLSNGRATDDAVVSIVINGVNARPVARADTFDTDEDVSFTVTAGELLSNDSDPDGDLVPAISRIVSSENGTAVLSGADVVFTPDAGFTGRASFIYEIADATSLTSTATAAISVNEVVFDGGFEIVLPEALSPGQSGSAQIIYTGDADTSVPTDGETLLFAISTAGGLVADPLSRGFSDTTFVLADSTPDGAFQAIDVSVKGTAGPRSNLGAQVQLADTDAETEIAARVSSLQPAFLAADVVARIEANLVSQFGTTVGSLTASLASHADRFASLGLNADSATAALAFAIEAAGDYGALQERGKTGAFGQGWSTLADLGLDIDGTTVQMRGLADIGALRALSVDASALYTVSNSAGRSVSLSGDALTFSSPARPQFEQNIDGRFQTTSAFAGTLISTDSGFNILTDDGETLAFDADGAFLHMVLSDGQRIIATHDVDMQITGLTGPNGASLAFLRNADGTVGSMADADGSAVTLGYNADGFLETVTRPEGQSTFAYNGDGDLVSATAPGTNQTHFAYDAFGRLASAEYGGGLQTEAFAYDGAGGLTITDGAGRSTQLDLLPGSVVGRISDGLGSASEIIYGEDGSIAGVRAPDGTETGFEFDDQGRLTQITDANGAVLGFTYGAEGEDPTSFTDAGGGTRSFDYDAGGRITEATWPDGTTLQFSYDDQGNLTGYSNRRGDDVTYTYDARGRLLSESDSSAGPTTYTYDARGRLTSATNDQGTTSLAYDGADRVAQIDYPTGKSLFYTYNDAGLRALMSDGEGYEVFYDYDALGRLTGLRDGEGPLVTYAYDGAGNLIREENGNGTVTTYDYDAAGRLTRIENHDPDDNVTSFNAYGYDAAGQRVSMETQDGAWTYGYDAIGQLTSAEFVSTNAELADKTIAYTYDAAGNRMQVVEDGVTTVYEANALNQYTRVGDATFTYDADGNMLTRTEGGETTTYEYDLENRLTRVTEADGTVLAFGYDLFGNRVSKTVDGVETEYLVDPFGLGDVVSEFTSEARAASYVHGLGLAAGEIGGVRAWYDTDAVGSVTTMSGTAGELVNAYAYTPFGMEMREVEGIANAFEFNGAFGVAEDAEDLTFMRARSYDPGLGRFLSEEPLFAKGDIQNFYRFSFNEPIGFIDPTGNFPTGQDFANGFGVPAYDNPQLYADMADRQIEDYEARKAAQERLIENFKLADMILSSKANPFSKQYDVAKVVFAFPVVLREAIDFVLDPVFGIIFESSSSSSSSFSQTLSLSFAETAASDGDPHITTFDGSGYSFQAVGEFILFRPKSGESEFQVRQEAFGASTTVSVNTAVTALLGDANVGVYAGQDTPLVIDGTAVDLSAGESIAVGSGTVFFDGRAYVITDALGNGVWAKPSTTSKFMNLRPFASEDLRGELEGLLGDADGDRSNDFTLRDGTVLSQPLPVTQLYGAYAEDWRIDQASSLFVYGEGEDTETFTNRDFPSTRITLEDLDPADRAAAEAAAAAAGLEPGTFEFETTVLDIALTGVEEFAEAVEEAPIFEEEREVVPVEINDVPAAGADTAIVDEDGTVDIDVLANDTDPEDDDLTLTGGTDPNGGTVTVVDNQLRFTPAADFNGETTLSYSLADAGGNTVSGSVVVTVTARADAPIAVDDGGDGFTTDENTALTTASVLLNDSDADGDTLRVAGVSLAGTLGMVTDNGDGTFVYDPDGAFDSLREGEIATDTFSYTVADGTGGTAVATVSVTISGVVDDATGSDESETLVGTDAVEDLDAMGGDDLVDSGGGADRVTLGSGADALVGAPGSIFGDTVTDFSAEDRIVFEGVAFARNNVTIEGEPVVISVDTDQDGTTDGSLTVLGDFSSGDFMAVSMEGDTTITFETFLPVLQNRQAVDPGLVKGVINQAFLTGDGSSEFRITMSELSSAGYDNVVGVYEMDGSGNIVDPRILFENANADKSAVAGIADVEAGHRLGFFIVQDGADWVATLADDDILSFVNDVGLAANLSDGSAVSIAVNGAAVDEMVFHSFSGDMNSDGVQHALSGVEIGGEAISVGFEDLTGGGDLDYQDVVFRVEIVDDFAIV